MPSVNVTSVRVQMGSNRLQLELCSDSALTCREFVSLVLTRCHIQAHLTRTYALFESTHGIERRLHSRQQLLQVCAGSPADPSRTFVVRKCLRAERQALQNMNSRRHQEMVKKCFEKLKSGEASPERTWQRNVHLSSIEQEYLKQVIRGQPPANKASPQKAPVVTAARREPVFEREASLAANINVLQFLYSKLKRHNGQQTLHGSYEKLIDNDSCGNSSDEEASSVGSRSNGSNLHAFESLV